ncbi:MAG: GNAT family N-acetyltransferase [Bacteroidales bacterium]|nr:GNAT family N-acetyltransferase [Bacteroidales bacterium]
MEITLFDSNSLPTEAKKTEITTFLFNQLEQYGDPYDHILMAIDYSLDSNEFKGGFVLEGRHEGEIVGVVVVNNTGMMDYIPENILVYIATHEKIRGKGFGKLLMKKAIESAKGNIALHVEPDNPAAHLYRKLGFTSKYLEMRLLKA